MTLVAFVRGVNVGGHRRFRPSELAKALKAHDVVSIGAAGTFVVRKPGSRAKFLAEFRRRLPFDAEIAVCDARELLGMESASPFEGPSTRADIVRFVSVLTRTRNVPDTLPMSIPNKKDWLVRVVAANGQFVFGEYRRHMKTIGYLGKLDSLFGVPATTRNWNTIRQVISVLKG